MTMNKYNSDDLKQSLSQFLENYIKEEGFDVVVIDAENYKRLLKSAATIQALESGGVDNWEYYDECMIEANEIYDDMLNDAMKHKIEFNPDESVN